MTVGDYLDRARASSGMPSDTKLAIMLGVTQSQVSDYRRGHAKPSARTMLRLCDLAKADPEAGLLDWISWHCPDDASRAVVARMKARLAA